MLSKPDTFLNLTMIVPTDVPCVARTSPVIPEPALFASDGAPSPNPYEPLPLQVKHTTFDVASHII